MIVPISFYSEWKRDPTALYPNQKLPLLFLLILAILLNVKCYLIVVLLRISLMTNNVEYFSCIFSHLIVFGEMSVQVFVQFLFYFIFWSNYHFAKFFIYSGCTSFVRSVYWILSFTLCLAFLFSKWCLLKGFNFNKAQFIIFLTSKCFSQNFLPTLRSQIFSPKFLFLKFYGLSFYNWSKIHGKLYVYIVWGKGHISCFFFSTIWISNFCNTICWRLSFLPLNYIDFVKNQLTRYVWVYF